jgi:hypothetical protein
MKYVTPFAIAALLSATGFACSSDPEENDGGNAGSGNTNAGSGNTNAGAGNTNAGSGNTNAGSGNTTAGQSTGGGGAGTAGTPATGGAGSGGTGGTGGTGGAPNNPDAVVATCMAQMYTPTDTPGAACVTKAVPATPLIAAFETAGPAAGWGVYPNMDGQTGFMPTMATPSAGGANGTTMALNFTVTNVTQGIKLELGFGTQCQDVRTFEGLSFWAKGTIDAATVPYAVEANTIVIQVGSEKSLLGGCVGDGCSAAPPDKRVAITPDWKEYRVPWDCFGDGLVFDGYYRNILFSALGTNATFSIDEVGYY